MLLHTHIHTSVKRLLVECSFHRSLAVNISCKRFTSSLIFLSVLRVFIARRLQKRNEAIFYWRWFNAKMLWSIQISRYTPKIKANATHTTTTTALMATKWKKTKWEKKWACYAEPRDKCSLSRLDVSWYELEFDALFKSCYISHHVQIYMNQIEEPTQKQFFFHGVHTALFMSK